MSKNQSVFVCKINISEQKMINLTLLFCYIKKVLTLNLEVYIIRTSLRRGAEKQLKQLLEKC